jgi:hypothetical protein
LKRKLVCGIKHWYKGKTANIREFEEVKRQGYAPSSYDYKKHYRAAKVEYSNLEKVAPLDENNLLPTRFGNILLASEQYSEEKYRMDGFTLWTRLLQALPKQLIDQVEEKNNQMLFLLNSSLLSYINGGIAFLIGLIGLPCQIFPSWSICHPRQMPCNYFESSFEKISPSEYLVISIAFFVVGYVIYRLALPVTEAFGLLVRSGFDLYRFDMLRQLNIEVPPHLVDEMQIWEKISEYMSAGNRLARDSQRSMDFDYFAREELTNVNFVQSASESL